MLLLNSDIPLSGWPLAFVIVGMAFAFVALFNGWPEWPWRRK